MVKSSDPPAADSFPSAEEYGTVTATGQAEVKIKRSRFLAEAAPAASLAEARQVVAIFTHRYHDCRHVCFGWRGGHEGTLQEFRHDGGEPAGTAGEPILAALRSAQLTDTVIVVARYFGGIKLGTGGLARAYGTAAEAALAVAPRRKVRPGYSFSLRFAYRWQKVVEAVIARHGGKTLAEEYGGGIEWEVWFPATNWKRCAADLQEGTAGEVKMKAPAGRPEPEP